MLQITYWVQNRIIGFKRPLCVYTWKAIETTISIGRKFTDIWIGLITEKHDILTFINFKTLHKFVRGRALKQESFRELQNILQRSVIVW